MLECRDPGLLSTVQDLGRGDAARFGVARAGAADRLALEAANLLCGNEPGAPALEMTLRGATFAVLTDGLIAIAGADMGATVPDEERLLATDAAHHVRAGTTLTFDTAETGVRAYLALEAGIAAERILGSASADPTAGFAGLAGRPLRMGDVLAGAVRRERGGAPGLARRATIWPGPGPASAVHRGIGPATARILPGPHAHAFSVAARQALVETTWSVSAHGDRAGLRLDGEPIERGEVRDPVSLPVLPGAIQVPASGRPIILGPDGPTVGGYPVLAVVITADLPIPGQLGALDTLRFAWCSMEEAHDRLRASREDRAAAIAALR